MGEAPPASEEENARQMIRMLELLAMTIAVGTCWTVDPSGLWLSMLSGSCMVYSAVRRLEQRAEAEQLDE